LICGRRYDLVSRRIVGTFGSFASDQAGERDCER
jgi:hypothetical protein